MAAKQMPTMCTSWMQMALIKYTHNFLVHFFLIIHQPVERLNFRLMAQNGPIFVSWMV